MANIQLCNQDWMKTLLPQGNELRGIILKLRGGTHMEKRHQLVGYSKIEDREHSLMKFNSYADFKENLIDREDLEGYTDYIVI